MKTITLQSPNGEVRWEATVDGCLIEVARELKTSDHPLVERHLLPSSRHADEFVAEHIAALQKAGFVYIESQDFERSADGAAAMLTTPTTEPTTADIVRRALSSINEFEAKTAHHPALLQNIADSNYDLDAYLVYADWLMERGDPLGLLIALQHAVETTPALRFAVKRLLSRFVDHFVPRPQWLDAVTWRLGFVDTLRGGTDLKTVLAHRSTTLLRGLRCDSSAFIKEVESPLPHLQMLVLTSLAVASNRDIQLSATPNITTLVLEAISEGALRGFKAQLPPKLQLLVIRLDHVDHPPRLLETLLEIPEPRPRLGIDYYRGDDEAVRAVVAEVKAHFRVVDQAPSWGLSKSLRERAEDDENEHEADLLDRICARCGNVFHNDEDEGRCGACGGPIAILDDGYDSYGLGWADAVDDDGLDEDGEFCTYDAARDPNFDPQGADNGVDRRWEAPKDDAFDLDEEQ